MLARQCGLFYSKEPPMSRIDSIALEFSIAGCSVVRGNLAGVPCLTVAGNGKTILVLCGDPNKPGNRKAADMWDGKVCWCNDRATAHAIAHCLQAGEFDAD